MLLVFLLNYMKEEFFTKTQFECPFAVHLCLFNLSKMQLFITFTRI